MAQTTSYTTRKERNHQVVLTLNTSIVPAFSH